jgi:hypothetical protein
MPCFNDWKHFCFVLREIASGVDGRPVSGDEAQQKAQVALTSAGYRWLGYVPKLETSEAIVSPPQRASRRRA